MTTNDDPGRLKARQTYDWAADSFDAAPLAFWDRYGRATVMRLDPEPGWRVLDVGCGTGASALPTAEQVGPEGRVLGVDLADKMLDLARDKAAAQGLTNLELRAADMTALDLRAESLDAVVSVFSIFFVDDMPGLVRRLWRLLRPGGRLAVTTWGPRFLEPATGAWWRAVARERPELAGKPMPWELITEPEALGRMLAAGGVGAAEIAAEAGRQRLAQPADWWQIVLGTGYRWVVEQLGPEAAARVRDDNLAWLAAEGVSEVETNVVYALAEKR